MSAASNAAAGDPQRTHRRKWLWIKLAATVALLSWVALGAGIVMDAGTTAMFVLATLAAVTTEGTIWLAALLLGVSAYQARRRLWETIRSRMR